MKDKIIARFRAKYASVNLTKKRLEDIAAKLETKITDENEIDVKLDELNEVFPFAEIAKQDDRVVQLEALNKKKAEPEPDPSPTPTPVEVPQGEAMPDWAKTVIETNKALAEQMASLNKDKVSNSRKAQIETALKDADDAYKNKALKDFSRMAFENEEAFNEYLTEAAEDLTTYTQKFSDAGLGVDRPQNAFGSAKLGDKDVSPAVKQFLDNEAAKKKTA